MKCPFCHQHELKVIDSRDAPDTNAIRRRRECLECSRRFTTFEGIELSLQVLKRDGRYEEFQQSKLVNGIDAACRHTTVSHEKVISIAAEITNELMLKQEKTVSTTELGKIVMKMLQSLDPIAYIRFACEYRRFKDVEELMEAVELFLPKKEHKRKKSYIN